MSTFGALLSTYDCRDYKLASNINLNSLPTDYQIPPPNVKNQQTVSSCVAFAISSLLTTHISDRPSLSTNFIYGNQKKVFDDVTEGMSLRDACKFVRAYGDVLSNECPGNMEIPDCYASAEAILEDKELCKSAKTRALTTYITLNSIDEIKYALVHYGAVLASWKWGKFKVVNGVLTGSNDDATDYHAMLIYGYNDKGFMVQNSWGYLWGERGRCIIPYSYVFREAYVLTNNPKNDVVYTTSNWWTKLVNSIGNFIQNLKNK